jgi:beta-lactam-binding protein with PASTA domain
VPINPLCANGNKVAAQDPTAGTEVPAGTTVFLFAGEVVVPTGPTAPTGPTGGT